MSTFQSLTCSGNLEYNTMTKNGETYPKLIWEGAYYMLTTQEIPIDLQSYPNGVALQWSRYDPETATPSNFGYSTFNVLKEMALSGGGFNIFMISQTGSLLGLKYIYVSNTKIWGHEQNNQTMSTAIGTAYNKNWVLRRVVAY